MRHRRDDGVRRRPYASLAGTFALTVLLVACGSTAGDRETSGTVAPTTVAPTTTETATIAVTTAPKEPSCDEVTAVIAKISPSDRAILKKSQVLFFSRPPGSGDGWRIMTQPMGPQAPEAVYYDWTPATGLGPPVAIPSAAEQTTLRHSSTMVITMRCATLDMPAIPGT